MKIKIKKKILESEMDSEMDYRDIAKNALKRANQMQLGSELRPEDVSEDFPINIVDVPDHMLGQLHSVFTALACYAESQTAIVDNDLMVSQAELEHVRSKLYLLSPGDETVNEAKSRVQTHPDFVKANMVYLSDKALYNLSKSKLEAYNRKCQCVSREITRRSNSFPHLTKDVQ